MKKQFLALTSVATMMFVCNNNYSQNVLPTSGNVGIGTATPTSALEVNGETLLGTVRVRDSAVFEQPVIIKDSLRIENKLRVDQDVRIIGKTVMVDNARAKSNFTVEGTTRLHGNLRLLNLADSTFQENKMLILQPNGLVKSVGTLSLLDALYEPSNCFVGAPHWVSTNSTNPPSIYTDPNCLANVGVGISTPLYKLDVIGNARFSQTVGIGVGPQSNTLLTLESKTPKTGVYLDQTNAADYQFGYFVKSDNETSKLFTGHNSVTNKDVFVVYANGNVGIGTASTPYKLSVDGSIGARYVKVELDAWPDYVFKTDYELMTIEDLETYIKANNHLPNVPSEKEIVTNGLDLGQMDAILLEKIEELTLYLIQLNKENEELKLAIEKLNQIIISK